jgi:Gram-negative bacterial TonB protein C-terminal
MRPIPMRLRNSSLTLCLIAAVCLPTRSPAQTTVAGLRQVRWPLLDLVVLPDSSAGLWLLVSPNKGTVQWHAGASVVSLAIDPVTTFQWVMVGRKLVSESAADGKPETIHLTPPLRGRCGRAFVLLARNSDKAGSPEAFTFLVSDSASHSQWKTFASAAQVDTLLTAVEQTAWEQEKWTPNTAAPSGVPDSNDTPVEIVSQRAPRYPHKLTYTGREGRVWMSYLVDSTGRPDPESFRALLSDDQQFTDEAVSALRHSKFRPARLRGRPVPQHVFQVIAFRVQAP